MFNNLSIEKKKEIYLGWTKKIREDKIKETLKKRDRLGYTDSDDYNYIVPYEGYEFKPIWRNNYDDFYGYEGWSENYKAIVDTWEAVVVPYDALCGNYFALLSMKKRHWEDKECRYIKNPEYPELLKQVEKYAIVNPVGGANHFVGDVQILLQNGWGGIRKKILHYSQLNPTDKDTTDFYKAELLFVDTTIGWIKKTSDRVEELLENEEDEYIRENLKEMLIANRHIETGIPRNMREACQLLAWYNLSGRSFNRDGAGCQLDEILLPYYEHDINNGIIDDEDAIFFIIGLFMSDTKYYQLAGKNLDGSDKVNKLSWLILEAADRLDVALNLTIRVHKGINRKFFRKCVEMLFKHNNGWPRFSGDDSLVNGLMKRGFSEEVARKRIAVGCNWMATPGIEYCLQDTLKINFGKLIELAFYDMMNQKDHSVQKLWELFEYHLQFACDLYAKLMHIHFQNNKHLNPELHLNLFMEGPIEKGKDITEYGTVPYYNIGLDGSGLAVAADSFAAVEQRIEKEGKLTWEEVKEAMINNFSNDDNRYIRALMQSAEKFGQYDSLGLKWAEKIVTSFSQKVVDLKTEEGATFCPGLFSWSLTIKFGKDVGATPDGRLAGAPINHGANPFPSSIKSGEMTTMSDSIARVQCGYGNTAPFQMELDPQMGKTEEGITNIMSLIETHLENGGTLINVNILDKDKILKAHKNPDLFPDLVVRVTGFTAYFASLSPEFRQLVVDRIIMAN